MKTQSFCEKGRNLGQHRVDAKVDGCLMTWGCSPVFGTKGVNASYTQSGFDGVVEVGMVFAIEAYVGARSGGEGVKLEEQFLVTEAGPQSISAYLLGL